MTIHRILVIEPSEPNLGLNGTWSTLTANAKGDIRYTGSLVSVILKQSSCMKTALKNNTNSKGTQGDHGSER